MMGSVFAFTQYLQFAHGYSALEAGAAMLPLALGLVIGSGTSNRLAAGGRTRVIAGGLVGVAAVLSTSLAWTPDMAPVLLGLVTFGLAVSMGVAMAPATDAVMSAVPEAKAGVGSAMSDVTRQVGGALGVAVIGSIISTAYSRDMTGSPEAVGESMARSRGRRADRGHRWSRTRRDRRPGLHRRARPRPHRRRRSRAGRRSARAPASPERPPGRCARRRGAAANRRRATRRLVTGSKRTHMSRFANTRMLLLGAPLTFAALLMLHPGGDGDFSAVVSRHADRWLMSTRRRRAVSVDGLHRLGPAPRRTRASRDRCARRAADIRCRLSASSRRSARS